MKSMTSVNVLYVAHFLNNFQFASKCRQIDLIFLTFYPASLNISFQYQLIRKMCKQPTKLGVNFNLGTISTDFYVNYRRKLALKIKETLEKDDQFQLSTQLDKLQDINPQKNNHVEIPQNGLVK